jgi:hypothetical protein
MTIIAVILFVVGVVAVGLGVILFANGVKVSPDGRTEPERVKSGLGQIPWGELFRLMPRSMNLAGNEDRGRTERLKGGGAFCVLIGIVMLVLAILALIAALL